MPQSKIQSVMVAVRILWSGRWVAFSLDAKETPCRCFYKDANGESIMAAADNFVLRVDVEDLLGHSKLVLDVDVRQISPASRWVNVGLANRQAAVQVMLLLAPEPVLADFTE